MKPFDLDEYKKNPSRELVTRDGHKARIICTDRVYDIYPIVALIQIGDQEIIQSYTELGHEIHGAANPLDLFFASVKHKGWLNIYKTEKGFYTTQNIYDTMEEAKISEDATFLKSNIVTIQIEWEE